MTSEIDSSEFDCLVISHEISRELYYQLTSMLENNQQKKSTCLLFLTTFGGDPHAGFRIGRCLRHHYQKLKIIVPSYCKSAGTLIAIAADELVIGNTGELGPLDIQVNNPNEMLSRNSGLDIQQALTAIDNHASSIFIKYLQLLRSAGGLSTRLAGEIATKLAVGQTEGLYAQVDPLRIGELQRAMQIAHSYGKTLDGYSKNLKPEALENLITGYPSHSYVIDRKEASSLFNKVGKPSSFELFICAKLRGLLETQREFCSFVPKELIENQGAEDVTTQGVPNEQFNEFTKNEGTAGSNAENAEKPNGKRRRNSKNNGGSVEKT